MAAPMAAPCYNPNARHSSRWQPINAGLSSTLPARFCASRAIRKPTLRLRETTPSRALAAGGAPISSAAES
eukprot:342690-Pyramimonas_sp.AAC.1